MNGERLCWARGIGHILVAGSTNWRFGTDAADSGSAQGGRPNPCVGDSMWYVEARQDWEWIVKLPFWRMELWGYPCQRRTSEAPRGQSLDWERSTEDYEDGDQKLTHLVGGGSWELVVIRTDRPVSYKNWRQWAVTGIWRAGGKFGQRRFAGWWPRLRLDKGVSLELLRAREAAG